MPLLRGKYWPVGTYCSKKNSQPRKPRAEISFQRKSAMTIAVLIATCNRADMLRTCIELLLANDRQPDEIVVADQSDDDSTREMLERVL